MMDLFGLHKDVEERRPEPDAGPASSEAKESRRALWAKLLLVDALALAGFGAAIFWRLRVLASPAPALVTATRVIKIKKPEAPAPAAPKTQAPPPAAPVPPAAPAKGKGPIGSPSVNAPDLPQRNTPNPAGSGAAKASKADAPKASSHPVKSVNFTYSAPDAKEVHLLGPFLVRSGGRKAMTKDSNGLWQTSIYLNTGMTYRYRFEITDNRGKRTLSPKQSLESF